MSPGVAAVLVTLLAACGGAAPDRPTDLCEPVFEAAQGTAQRCGLELGEPRRCNTAIAPGEPPEDAIAEAIAACVGWFRGASCTDLETYRGVCGVALAPDDWRDTVGSH